MKKYNIKQQEAITFSGKHLLLLAGAGTGKTKTIVGRAEYLINTGVPADQIQILTFTKRAASEIVERVKAGLSNYDTRLLNGSTFHSWCNQLITKFPNLFGAASYTVIDPDDQLSLMKMACGRANEEYGKVRIKPQQILDIFSFARNTRSNLSDTICKILYKGKSDPQTTEDIASVRPQIAHLIKEYQSQKKRQQYIDYDDLLLVVANRLHKDEEARNLLACSYQHILIDEMQDTNPLQWYLLKPFETICSLFCVGDDAQSIYSFRGADFKNVHLFKDRIKDAEVKVLDKNYRSTQEILDISNWLLETSPIKYSKKLIASRGAGTKPIMVNVDNQFQEANYIATQILESFTQGGSSFSDFLILSRSQYYTRPLQAVFLQKKIPYQTFGGRKFLEAAHIKDVIAVMRVINNPLDEIAWIRFFTFIHGIGPVKATNYMTEVMQLDPQDIETDGFTNIIPGKEGEQATAYYNAVASNKGRVQKAVQDLYKLMEFELAMKYSKDWLEKRKPDFPVLEMLAENYGTLGEFIAEGVLDNSTNVGGGPTLEGSKLSTAEQKDHVTISTVHSAKGLEADVCFVLNVSPKSYPSAYSLGNIDEIEEDRRVLYVALTRAKNTLYITRSTESINAIHRTNTSATHESVNESAYFLEAIPDDLVNQTFAKSCVGTYQDAQNRNEIDLDVGMDFS